MKIANLLTILRVILIPVIAVLIYSMNVSLLILSFILFLIASLTDILDGYFARKHKNVSAFGTIFDPLIDKLLILTMLFIFSNLGYFPLWIPLIVLSAELTILSFKKADFAQEKIFKSNWAGKFKMLLYVLLIIAIQGYLVLTKSNMMPNLENFTYYIALFTILAFLLSSLAFLFLNRKLIKTAVTRS